MSKGGRSTFANLTTACEPCNAGKSDKLLDDVEAPPPPPQPPAPATPPRVRLEPISEEEMARSAREIMDMLSSKGDRR